MDAKTRGDRGQGTGDRGQGTGDRGILQNGRQGYLRLSCEQRQEQDKSGARLPTTRVSYAPRAPRNSLRSHENDKKINNACTQERIVTNLYRF